MLRTLIRGLVIVVFSGVTAFYGGSVAYQIVHGSLWFDVIAWIYGMFAFLIGFLFASAGGRRRYRSLSVAITPVLGVLLLILSSSFRYTGRFSQADFEDFGFFFLLGASILAIGIGLGMLVRRELKRVMPISLWEQL